MCLTKKSTNKDVWHEGLRLLPCTLSAGNDCNDCNNKEPGPGTGAFKAENK